MRATTLLTCLVSLSLMCVSVAASAGDSVGPLSLMAMAVLTALGCLSGPYPKTVGVAILLVVVLVGLARTQPVQVSLTIFVLPLPIGVLAFRGQMRPAVLLAVTDAVTTGLFATAEAASVTDVIANLLLWSMLVALTFIVGLLGNRALSHSQYILTALQRARAQDRRIVAAELHDSVTRLVAGIAIQAERTRLAHSDDPALAEAMTTISGQCRVIAANLRSMLAVLGARADADDPAPVTEHNGVWRGASPSERLQTESALLRAEGFEVVVEGCVPRGLAPALNELLGRVIAAALTNVRRHADPGIPVRIMLGVENGVVELVVVNGVPAAPRAANSARAGLRSLSDRADAVGATLTSNRSADAWVLHLAMPLLMPAEPLEAHP
ncbi:MULTISPECIES: sensor histidine kinase [Actinomyces]|uniref:histidine kinase n=1 Tax=Actinomyces respiraculi TaxID=2744574 RepID=A0A7T0PWK6_9ACTO|nr:MULTISPECIES: histidine kinase [Actinomyces]QPL05573.1 hypothetical protein ID810_00820 [Actinomyces respiraculi]